MLNIDTFQSNIYFSFMKELKKINGYLLQKLYFYVGEMYLMPGYVNHRKLNNKVWAL